MRSKTPGFVRKNCIRNKANTIVVKTFLPHCHFCLNWYDFVVPEHFLDYLFIVL